MNSVNFGNDFSTVDNDLSYIRINSIEYGLVGKHRLYDKIQDIFHRLSTFLIFFA